MGKKTEFLYLSERDTIEAGVLDAKKCIDMDASAVPRSGC